MRRNIALILISILALVLAACGGDTTTEEPADEPEEVAEETTQEDATEETETDDEAEETEDAADEEGQVFTEEELSEYNGQDGNPAYVAVDGVVYDVSDIEAWEGGEHFNGIVAGEDNSDAIQEAPHGDSVLEDLPVVGTLE